MTGISPKVQALIERLAAMDTTEPQQDKEAIERAIVEHRAALGLPERSVIIVEDPGAALRILMEGSGHRADFDPLWGARWGATVAASKKVMPDARGQSVHEAVRGAVRVSIWEAVMDAMPDFIGWEMYDSHWYRAFPAAQEAVDAVQAIQWSGVSDHPAIANAVAVASPMISAFVAGLFCYWMSPSAAICLLQPRVWFQEGQLHRADGPAVIWPSGEACHFWRGMQVPAWIIEEPHRITIAAIRDEPNQEIRRCMTEIYGLARYLRETGARLVHQDEYGKLWEVQVGEEAWRIVEVENGTPEPDGTRRTYTLNVTGADEVLGWPIETARAAVAATYGLREEEYCPELRT